MISALCFLSSVFCHLLFHADGFDRTGIDANAAIHTGVRVDYGFAVNHTNSFTWTFANTRFTACTLFSIDFSCHSQSFQKTTLLKTIKPSSNKTKHYYKITIGFQEDFSVIFKWWV